jgi:hypothetical protein
MQVAAANGEIALMSPTAASATAAGEEGFLKRMERLRLRVQAQERLEAARAAAVAIADAVQSPVVPTGGASSPTNFSTDESSSTPEEAEGEEGEVLLRENKNRFVLFPIKYDAIWNAYKKHKAAFWTAEEIDLAQDVKDWVLLTDDERHFIKVSDNLNITIHPPEFL